MWTGAGLVSLAAAFGLAGRFACPLHRPSIALLLSGAGVLLLLVEFHRPGRVLPGAAGVALLLLGAHAFSLQPVRVWAVLLVLVSFLLLCSPWLLPQRTELGPVGTAALSAALVFLPRAPGGRWVWLASSAGVVLGALCSGLTAVAGRARLAKRRLRPGTAASERWE